MSEADDLVDVGKFLRNWMDAGVDAVLEHKPEDFSRYLEEKMGIDECMIEELSKVCGEDTLTCPDERSLSKVQLLKSVPPEVNLVTTGLQKVNLERRQTTRYHAKKVESKLKYHRVDGPGIHYSRCQTLPLNAQPKTLQPVALLTVYIYKPLVNKVFLGPNLHVVYQVLGHQKLTDLRDKIHCTADETIVGEFSENPDGSKDIKAKDMYKSAFFFIAGTFYNDMRDPNCRDYSKHITEWAREPRRGVGPYTTSKMEDTTFMDLKVKLGYPYLYLHQGNCEHLIVFSDVRLLHPDEISDPKLYPLKIGQKPDRTPLCRVCSVYHCRWVTQGSPVTPEDPCFFCDTCFRALHYDEHGKKLMEFKAYPYAVSSEK